MWFWGLCATAAAADVRPFVAEYLGANVAVGLGCVVDAPPPEGAWTMSFAVRAPRRSGLARGEALCVVVRSPPLYLGDQPVRRLRCVAARGTEPVRFACDGGTAVEADAPVVDAEALVRWRGDGCAALRRQDREAEVGQLVPRALPPG